jgi:hypothetical protein
MENVVTILFLIGLAFCAVSSVVVGIIFFVRGIINIKYSLQSMMIVVIAGAISGTLIVSGHPSLTHVGMIVFLLLGLFLFIYIMFVGCGKNL